MATNYSTAVKNTRQAAVVTAIDAGAGAGKLEIGTAGMATVLATITLADPSGTVANGVLTGAGFPRSATATASGIAAAARVRDSNNVDIITGITVGMSAADIVMDNTNIASGQTVTINSLSLTHG
jgi:hypothetical protein